MSTEYLKEAPEFVARNADNWLISASNIGPNKYLSISFVRYVVKHIKSQDGGLSGGTESEMEVLATYSLPAELAKELAASIPRILDSHNAQPSFKVE
ncbi:hypothetical protein ACNY67_06940 [Pantoea sp. KXB45]|uniref:hypothetical protein n=1 Tax=Pantoea sp. KXB45 TaxID=3402309 RepID=UPI003AB12060